MNTFDENINELLAKKHSKLKLRKTKRQVTILSKPDIPKIKLTKEDVDKIKKKKLGTKLIKFKKKLYQKINNQNLNLLNHNLSSLKVKIKYLSPEVLLLKAAIGTYSIQKNKMKLLKSFEDEAINHELLHMATAFYDKKLKIGFCGFAQLLFYKRESFGSGLNEGYTELLSRRYFNDDNSCVTDGYEACMFFAEKLEELIGKDKMEEFYFNADLMGLYKYLKRFDEGTDAATFIGIMDNLITKRNVSNKIKDLDCQLLSCYLSKWFIKLKQEELSKNIIDKNTYDEEIYAYLSSLDTWDLFKETNIKQKEYLK